MRVQRGQIVGEIVTPGGRRRVLAEETGAFHGMQKKQLSTGGTQIKGVVTKLADMRTENAVRFSFGKATQSIEYTKRGFTDMLADSSMADSYGYTSGATFKDIATNKGISFLKIDHMDADTIRALEKNDINLGNSFIAVTSRVESLAFRAAEVEPRVKMKSNQGATTVARRIVEGKLKHAKNILKRSGVVAYMTKTRQK